MINKQIADYKQRYQEEKDRTMQERLRQEYETLESQFDFENRLSRITATLSIDRNQVDIFNFENYNIICRINNEVAIFIGQDENDNEVLLDHFLETFEMELFNFIGEDLSREKVLNHYNDIVLLVDEIVTGGVVLNIDEHSLYNRIIFEKTQTNNEKQEQQSQDSQNPGA